jgi:hypothetical protein
MLTMDYRLVDVLYSNQLEVNDLIGLGDEVVKILSIESTKEGFTLLVENDFAEKEVVEIFMIRLFYVEKNGRTITQTTGIT